MLDALGFDGSIHRAAYERMRWLGSLGAGHRWGALGVGRGRPHSRRHSLDARGVSRRRAIAFGTPLGLRYSPSTSGMLWCLGFRAANSAKNTSDWITTYNQRMTT